MPSTHTPGPWNLNLAGTLYVGEKTAPKIIANFSMKAREWAGRAEIDANARLIAAAPELLDMLKLLHKNRKELPTEMQWQRASELIAKAEGGAA